MNGQPRRRRQSGFSLIEVLITVLIIAIGLMGFAAMMLNSMKNNRLAMQRSMATAYAYDIIDCMRANRTAAIGGNYTVTFGGTLSGTTVAATDVTAWKTQLATLLPEGQGSISFAGNTVTVKIRWIETVNAGDTGQCTADPPVPPCHQFNTESTL